MVTLMDITNESMEEQFSECAKCEKPINYGEAYVSVTRSIEQADLDVITGDPSITVTDSVEIVTLCRTCGNSFNAHNILKIVKAIPDDSNLKSN